MFFAVYHSFDCATFLVRKVQLNRQTDVKLLDLRYWRSAEVTPLSVVLCAVPKCVSAGVISQVFPLHDLPVLHKLQKNWVRAFLQKQPLGKLFCPSITHQDAKHAVTMKH
jgi:hypothetical protein